MRLFTLIAIGLLLAAAPARGQVSGRVVSAPLVSKSRSFTIPFKIGATTVDSQRPVEVRLYASSDRGATWKQAASVRPEAGHFVFQAEADGEYWFYVRTYDVSGAVRPNAPPSAELRVLVRSQTPAATPSGALSGRATWPPDDGGPAATTPAAPTSTPTDSARPDATPPSDGAKPSDVVRYGDNESAGPLRPISGAPARESDGIRELAIDSTQFELDYVLPPQLAAGAHSVEVWGTRDGGATWRRYVVDSDAASPVALAVDGEGEYGFRTVVHGAGAEFPPGFPPGRGDSPEVWVRVDRTEPVCWLIRAEQGKGAASDRMTLFWEAKDALLAERPVSLFFSAAPEGPWRQIATGLENRGEHTWRLPPDVPASFYLRLEVQDAAGNVGRFTTGQPISPARVEPTGRIRGVRPLPDTRSASRRSGVVQPR